MKNQIQMILSIVVVLLVIGGTLLLASYSYNHLLSELSKQIVNDNKVIGKQLLDLFNENQLTDKNPEAQRKFLQQVCEEVELPNGGFICATDQTGKLMAMRGFAPGKSMTLASAQVTQMDGETTSTVSEARDRPFSGYLDRMGKVDVVASFPIGETGNRLLVHQNYNTLKNNVKGFINPMLLAGIAASLLMGIITHLATGKIICGYESKLEVTNRELTKSNNQRELYFQGFQHSTSALFITDKTGHIEYINPAFEQSYGYSKEEVIGQTPEILNPSKDEYQELGFSAEEYDELFKGMWAHISDPKDGVWDGEIPNKHKDSSIIWVHLVINAIKDSEGEIINYIGVPVDITKRHDEEQTIRMEIYSTINDLAEMRDNETGKHILRVSKFSRLLAEKIGEPPKFCQEIEQFSPLHDIGKVGIPDAVLLAERKLTADEFSIIKRHPYLGYEILQGKESMEMGADIAYAHHEKFDGTGYPRRLKGKEIPLAARIVTIADVYDALRSKRPYKEPWSHEKAVETIIADCGTAFDPHIIEAFKEIEPEFARISTELRD